MASLAFADQLHTGTLAGLSAFARQAFAHELGEDPDCTAVRITVERHDGVDVITYEWESRGIPVGGMTI